MRSTVILFSFFSDLALNPTRKQGLLNSTKKDGLWLYQSTWVPLKWSAACSAEKMLKQLWAYICPASGMPPNATSIYRNGVVQKRIAPRQSMMKFCTHRTCNAVHSCAIVLSENRSHIEVVPIQICSPPGRKLPESVTIAVFCGQEMS